MSEHGPLETWRSDSPLPEKDRRGFLGWMGRVGFVSIGAIAGLTATQQAASANHGECHTPAGTCCCLAFAPGGCPGDGSSHTCPGGYVKRWWWCCYSHALTWACSECVPDLSGTGESCFNSGATCSEYWFVSSSGC